MSRNEVEVWDPAVRIFHWALATAFLVAYLTEGEEGGLGLHTVAGYTVFGLILFRLVWGVIGPRHARFSDFVRSPRVVFAYARDVIWLRARRHLGHNPAGGAAIVAMLTALVLTALSGMGVYAIEHQAGPLAGLLAGLGERWEEVFEGLHEFLANLTLLFVFMHIAGVVIESLLHRENLVRAMFTGRKRAEP